MKEFFDLLFKFKIRALLIEATQNPIIQFFRYAFVGGIASVADWFVLWLLEHLGMHYMFATVLAFFAGLATNYLLAKKLVFKVEEARVGAVGEFIAYTLIGAVGLLITLGLMYLFTECMQLYFMISKIIATLIVLVWNFLARKLLIYKK